MSQMQLPPNKQDMYADLAQTMRGVVGPSAPTSANLIEPRGDLTIDEITKLAQAGIKMDWGDIKHRIKQADRLETHMIHNDLHMIRPLVQRWLNTETANSAPSQFGRADGMIRRFPFDQIAAAVHGDKVYVFVHVEGTVPLILEDDKHLYPSDGLMARLHLMMANQPNRPSNYDEQGASTQAAPPARPRPAYSMEDKIDAMLAGSVPPMLVEKSAMGMSMYDRAKALADSWKPKT